MTLDPGPSPRLHPETAPIFRAASGRPFLGEELDEICRVFPARAKSAAQVAELWDACASALGPSPAGAPSPRAFRADLAAFGQASISGEAEAISAWLDRWRDEAAEAAAPLLRRLGRAWMDGALRRLDASQSKDRPSDAWSPGEWMEWMHGWLGERRWRLGADFAAAATSGLMEFVVEGPRGFVPDHFWPPLLAGALGSFGSRLSGANLEGAFIGEGALEAALPANRKDRGGSGLLFLVTSPARAAEAGAMAAAGRPPEAVRAALRRTNPLPAPEPPATDGAP